MKKILLLSDTHSYIDEKIMKYVLEADEVWHAGDIGDVRVTDSIQKVKPLRAVFGNIDGNLARVEFQEDLYFECEGLRVLMTHIAGYPGRFNTRVRDLIKLHAPKLMICGHSHILKVQFDAKYDLLFMNPGAAGIHGFHQVRTMLRFHVSEGKVQQLEVIEFPKKV